MRLSRIIARIFSGERPDRSASAASASPSSCRPPVITTRNSTAPMEAMLAGKRRRTIDRQRKQARLIPRRREERRSPNRQRSLPLAESESPSETGSRPRAAASLYPQRAAEDHPVHLRRGRSYLLIHPARFVPETPRQRIFRHDSAPDLARDENHLRRARERDGDQLRRLESPSPQPSDCSTRASGNPPQSHRIEARARSIASTSSSGSSIVVKSAPRSRR